MVRADMTGTWALLWVVLTGATAYFFLILVIYSLELM